MVPSARVNGPLKLKKYKSAKTKLCAVLGNKTIVQGDIGYVLHKGNNK
jgi:hypothetical protein